MIEYIKGDVIKAFKEHQGSCCLMHQENCQSLNKAGFAKSLYDEFPEANPNKVMSQYFGEYLLKSIKEKSEYKKFIINLYTQYYPGSPSNKIAKINGYELTDNFNNRINALKNCLKRLNWVLNEDNTIFIPLIASGLAKDKTKNYISDLDYFQKYIAPVIEECLEDFTIKVYYL